MKTRRIRLTQFASVPLVCCLMTAAWFVCPPGTALAQEEAAPAQKVNPELEAAFKKMLDGATLVGHFTLTGRESGNLREERYTIESVDKTPDGRWTFRAQIRYGDHDVTVPITLPVKWAGDTPMIVVDELQIPALGTFDARVMFFKDHYAGYWRHGDAGGHLFGVIERDDEEGDETEENDAAE